MNMARYEQETIINFNEEEKTAGIYTHNKILRQKLAALARDRPEDCRLVKASRSGRVVDYTIPKSWIKIVPNRVLSDAEKMQRRNAIKKANFALDNAGRPQDCNLVRPSEGSDTPHNTKTLKIAYRRRTRT